VTRLPHEARAVVEATVARARLHGADRQRVRDELESHFLDALDAGVPLSRLLSAYGDAGVTARLIRRARRQSPPRAVAAALALASALAACYMIAVARVQMAPVPARTGDIEIEARLVADRVDRADTLLRGVQEDGIVESFTIAAGLRRRRTLWGELASVPLLERTLAAADSLLPGTRRAELVDSLRVLARDESLAPRRTIISRVIPTMTDRLYGANGRMDRGGLRLVQRTKGVTRPSIWASVLEPLYFAPSLSREDIRRDLVMLIDARIAHADSAALRLTARL